MNKGSKRLFPVFGVLVALGLVISGCGNQSTTPKPDKKVAAATIKNKSETTTPAANSQMPMAYVHLTVVGSGVEKGSDGKTHDAFLPGNFTLEKGVPTQIEIANYDEGPHTLTIPDLNIDIKVPGHVKDKVASVTKVVVTADKAGTFEWTCNVACDGKAKGWAMAQDGYMRGKVTVVDDNKLYDYMTIVGSGVKAGSDGKTHDTFLPGTMTFKQGKNYVLEIANYDEGPHTFTVPELNLNVQIPGHKETNVASVTKVEFTPDKAGTFEWTCNISCDGKANGWAMGQDDYMRGKVTIEP